MCETEHPPCVLLIFDCDGVLVDSEPIACEVVARVLSHAGFPVTCESIIGRFAGVADRDMFSLLEQEYGRAIPAEIRQQVAQQTLVELSCRVESIAGVQDALSAISLPKCVASGSDAERVRLSLSRAGLLQHFSPHIFTSEEVRRGKPEPDLFLHAARRMQAKPAGCVVIEDSRAGVQAGVAAGMCVLGFVGGSHCSANQAEALRARGARRVFGAMHELPGLLAEVWSEWGVR